MIVVRQPHIDSNYLGYFVSELEFRNLQCSDVSGVGGSLTRAQPKKVATYSVPIAPQDEQKQIAAKLDELLAQVDTIKTRLDAIPGILKRFRQSVLAAAVSGRLTEEWRFMNPNKTTDICLQNFAPIPKPARYKTRSTSLFQKKLSPDTKEKIWEP
ncbi:MAG: hypothetical protein GY820_32585 [Gammaproteobacteria bacterium]|nr:hypothetical protein [Gammaproteobacteria bacterium]